MKSNNNIKKKEIIIVALAIVGLILWSIFGIKLIGHKSTFIVDAKESECYSNCNEASLPIQVASPIEQYKVKRKVEYMKGIERRKVELAKIAEEKRLADLEAKRIAKQKAKEEAKKKQVVVSRGKESNDNWIVYEATHYSAFCNTGCTGITAVGYDVRNTIYHNGHRVIAVDPRKIKLGSLVEVQTSYGTFKALAGDTGGAIQGYKIDILVENDDVAYELGREKVQVRILN